MKLTTSIPMTDPRHPMHERLRREAAGPTPSEQQQQPYQYEDQYGNLRWSDTGHRAERNVHGGR